MSSNVQSIVRNVLLAVARRADQYQAIRGLRRDGWSNVVTGMGNSLADKTMNTQVAQFRRIGDNALSALFHGDATSRKACELRPKAALRRGVTFTLPKDSGGAAKSTEMLDEFERLDCINKTRLACTWENLYGGAALWVGLDDGYYGEDSQELPVDMTRIERVLFFKEIDRRSIWPDASTVDLDPMSPQFGESTHYLVDAGNGYQVRIHRDRLIIFPGITTTSEFRQSYNGWGISVLDVAWAALQRNGMVWHSAANMLANAQYVVYKLAGLDKILSAKDGEERTKARTSAMEMAKSMISAVLIDSQDEYIRENPNFGNLPEMMDRFMCDVSHHLDIPVTKLFGRSPAGMNATGESDADNWDESVEDYQAHHLKLRFHREAEFIIAQKQGPFRGVDPGGWKVSFPPLKQLSDVEKADVYLKTAQGDDIYMTHGALTENEVALSRFREEGYSTETSIDIEMREKLAKQDEEKLQAEAEAAVAQHKAAAENPLGAPEPDQAGAGGKSAAAGKKPAAKTTGD